MYTKHYNNFAFTSLEKREPEFNIKSKWIPVIVSYNRTPKYSIDHVVLEIVKS